MLVGFNPVIDYKSERIIIGSMPGSASLKAEQYYAYPFNSFWKIISSVFCNSSPFLSYSDKLNCLLQNRIALWDSLKFCDRFGSLDSNIKNEVPNDFFSLFSIYTNINFLIFNGKSAFNFFAKYNSDLLRGFDYAVMPSTSPANASMNFYDKLNSWKQVLIF